MANKNKRSKYEQIFDGQWNSVDGIQELACCDCGLVHAMAWRLSSDGKIEVKMDRLPKETSVLRRHYRHEFKKA